ncbi:MAG: hypothetical protein J6J79_09865 [Lachnospiraceae bacterium]|nr:hypothetical protein [Lachnospiraceae bacterium]
MNTKKFSLFTIGIMLLGLIIFAIPTIIIDPYFHYHAPLKNLEYPINNQRYQNDGMLKHFSYDAMIIGTSMTLNFKPDEFDKLFDVNSLHVSFLGGSYKEIGDNMMTGLKYNPDIKIILRGLDLSHLDDDKDYLKGEKSSYPTYLYDANIFNDIEYLWNKEVFDKTFEVFEHTKKVRESSYVEKEEMPVYGKEIVLESFDRIAPSGAIVEFTEEDKERVLANIRQNVTSAAEKYPDVTFYYFWTPYSICYWDEICLGGKVDYMLEAETVAIEEMLKYENIRLFSFADNFDLVCNLDNYCDQGHYSPHINSKILEWIRNGEYELTAENYKAHIADRKDFYKQYDYDAIYK